VSLTTFLDIPGPLSKAMLIQVVGLLVVLAAMALPPLALSVLALRAVLCRKENPAASIAVSHNPVKNPHKVSWLDAPITRRAVLGAVGFELSCMLYGWLLEPDWIEVTRHRIETPKLPGNMPPLRIVHLTDLHLEEWGYRESRLAALVMDQKPDLVLLTGDYANNFNAIGLVDRILGEISVPLGIWAVFGNWERPDSYFIYFRKAPVEVLDAEVRELPLGPPGVSIELGGVHMHNRENLPRVSGSFNPAKFSILLHHTPDGVLALSPPGPDLMLCGHTHGGQVRLPFYGAVITLTQVGKQYEAGGYRVGDTTLYVSRGIGMEGGRTPRVRFLCRPEIPVFDIIATGPPVLGSRFFHGPIESSRNE